MEHNFVHGCLGGMFFVDNRNIYATNVGTCDFVTDVFRDL